MRPDTMSTKQTNPNCATLSPQEEKSFQDFVDHFFDFCDESVFQSQDPIAHCISLDASMSAGIAKEVAKISRPTPGQLKQAKVGSAIYHKKVYHLVTKKRYFHKPTLQSVRASLESMAAHARTNDIRSISMPKIACGLDRLSWPDVEDVIRDTCKGIKITVYTGHRSKPVTKKVVPAKTSARAVPTKPQKPIPKAPVSAWDPIKCFNAPPPSAPIACPFPVVFSDVPIEGYTPIPVPPPMPKPVKVFKAKTPVVANLQLSNEFSVLPIEPVVESPQDFTISHVPIGPINRPKPQRKLPGPAFTMPRAVKLEAKSLGASDSLPRDVRQVPRPFYTSLPKREERQPTFAYGEAELRLLARQAGQEKAKAVINWRSHIDFSQVPRELVSFKSFHRFQKACTPKMAKKISAPEAIRATTFPKLVKQAGLTSTLRELITLYCSQYLKQHISDYLSIAAHIVSIFTSIVSFFQAGIAGKILHAANLGINAYALFNQLYPSIAASSPEEIPEEVPAKIATLIPELVEKVTIPEEKLPVVKEVLMKCEEEFEDEYISDGPGVLTFVKDDMEDIKVLLSQLPESDLLAIRDKMELPLIPEQTPKLKVPPKRQTPPSSDSEIDSEEEEYLRAKYPDQFRGVPKNNSVKTAKGFKNGILVRQSLDESARILFSKIMSVVAIFAAILMIKPSSIFTLDFSKIQASITSLWKFCNDGKQLLEWATSQVYSFIFSEDSPDQKLAVEFMDYFTTFNSTPARTLISNRVLISQCEKKVKLARDFLLTKKDSSNVYLTSLSRQLDASFDKCSKLRDVLSAALPKQAAVGVMIAGEAGIGKTAAGMNLATRFDASLYGKKGVYKMDHADNYFRAYAGEEVAYIEEFCNTSSLKEDKLHRSVNTMLSNGAFNLEGAFEKNQPSDLKLIVTDTNSTFEDIGKMLQLNLAAKIGWFSRFILVEAVWTLDRELLEKPRGENGHLPDFEHLRFKLWRVARSNTDLKFVPHYAEVYQCNVKKVVDTISLSQLQSLVSGRLEQAKENFAVLFPDADERVEKLMSSSLKPQAGHHTVINIHGQAGDGKSTFVNEELLPYFDLVSNYHVIHKADKTWESFARSIKNARIPSHGRLCIVVDDGILNEEDEAEYNRIYNFILPNHSLIIFLSNSVPRPLSYFSRLAKMSLVPLNNSLFSLEATYRRAGYDGNFICGGAITTSFNPHLCFTSTKVGLRNTQGEVIPYGEASRVIYTHVLAALKASNQLEIRNVDLLPHLDVPANFNMDFPSIEAFQKALSSKSHLVYARGRGYITVDPSLQQTLMKQVNFDELRMIPKITTTDDVFPVITTYMKAFRSMNIVLTGSVRIEGLGSILVKDNTVYVAHSLTSSKISFAKEGADIAIVYDGRDYILSPTLLAQILFEDIKDPCIDVELVEILTRQKKKCIESLPVEIFQELLKIQRERRMAILKAQIAAATSRALEVMWKYWWVTAIVGWFTLSKLWKCISSLLSPSPVSKQKAQGRKTRKPNAGDESHPGQNRPAPKIKSTPLWDDEYGYGGKPAPMDPELEAELDSYWACSKQSITPDFNVHPGTSPTEIFSGGLERNMVKVVSTTKNIFGCLTESTSVVFGLGICEDILVAPRHILYCDGDVETDKVYVYDEVYPTKRFLGTALPGCEGRDLVFIQVEGLKFRDISQLVMREKEQVKRASETIFCRKYQTEKHYVYGKVISVHKTPKDVYSDGRPIKDFAYISLNASVGFATYFGDCGLPYLDPLRLKMRSGVIQGIHVAGSCLEGVPRAAFSVFDVRDVQEALEARVVEVSKESKCVGIDLHEDYFVIGDEQIFFEPEERKLYEVISTDIPCNAEFGAAVEVLGCTEHFSSKFPVNSIVPSPSFDSVQQLLGEPKKIPNKPPRDWTEDELAQATKCLDGTVSAAIHQSVMFGEVLPEPDKATLKFLVEAMKPEYSELFSDACDFAKGTEVLNGIKAGEKYHEGFKPLQVDTACGYTLERLFGLTKKSEVVKVAPNGSRTLADTPAGAFVREKMRSSLILASKGLRSASVFKTCLKAEKLPRAKAWKSRVFECQDLHDCLLERCVLGRWSAANAMKRDIPSCRVGTNVYSDWDCLARFHAELPFHIDVDYSRWDKRAHHAAFNAVIELLTHARLTSTHDSSQHVSWINSMKTVIRKACTSIHHVENIMFKTSHGIPSGLITTATLNSALNDIVVLFAIFSLYRKSHGEYPSLSWVRENFRISTYGDDLLISCSAEAVKFFTFFSFSKCVKKNFGCVATASTKDGNEVPFHSSLEDCTFISRYFIYNPRYQMWFGALKKESIEALLFWVQESLRSDKNYLSQLCENALMEASYWRNPEYYRLIVSAVSHIKRENNLEVLIPTYLYTQMDNARLMRGLKRQSREGLTFPAPDHPEFIKMYKQNGKLLCKTTHMGDLEFVDKWQFSALVTDYFKGKYPFKWVDSWINIDSSAEYGFYDINIMGEIDEEGSYVEISKNTLVKNGDSGEKEFRTLVARFDDAVVNELKYTYSTEFVSDDESEVDDSEYCCKLHCFREPSCQVDGRACRKCRSFGYCRCKCVTYMSDKTVEDDLYDWKEVKLYKQADRQPTMGQSSARPTASAAQAEATNVTSTGLVTSELVTPTGFLETAGHVSAQGLNLNVGAIPPAPQTTGMPFDKLAQMKTTSGQVVRNSITSDTKTSAPVFKISNDPTLLPADHKVWLGAHQYWSAQTCHTLEIYGTEGLVGSVIVGWVPDISKTYTVNDLRKVNFAILPLNKYSSLLLTVDDFRNNSFNRLTKDDPNPYPGYVVMLYEPLANKFAADGKAFEVGVWSETYFHPACEFYGPIGSLAPSTDSLPLDSFASTSITAPHEPLETCNLVVNSTQIPLLVSGSNVLRAPRVLSVNTHFDVQKASSRNLKLLKTFTISDTVAEFDAPLCLFFSGTILEDHFKVIQKAVDLEKIDLADVGSLIQSAFNSARVTLSAINNPNGFEDFLNGDVSTLEVVKQLSSISSADIVKLFGFTGKLRLIPGSVFHLATKDTSAILGLVWNTDVKTTVSDNTVTVPTMSALPLFPFPLTAFKVPLDTDWAKCMVTFESGVPLLFTAGEPGVSPVTLQVTSTIQPSFVVHDSLCAVGLITENATVSFSSKLANAPIGKFHQDITSILSDQLSLLGSQILAFELYNGTNLVGTFCYSRDFGLACAPTSQNRVLTGLQCNSITIRNLRAIQSEIIPSTSTNGWDQWVSASEARSSSAFLSIRSADEFGLVRQAGMIFGGAAGLLSGLSDAYWKEKQMDWQSTQNDLNREQARWLQENSNAAALQRATLGYQNTIDNTRLSNLLAGQNQRKLAQLQAEQKRLTDANSAQLRQQTAGVVNQTNVNSGRASGTGVTTGATDRQSVREWTRNGAYQLPDASTDSNDDENDPTTDNA
ncbi:MAG: polyprotein [Diabrotica undecimpunctata virus 1]|nr:MAG: polyprotein [Diabrotica undecimpunctata virus 1]